MNGSTGRPHELLERVGVSNIGYLHLTDTDGTLRDGGTSKHLACGDGHANISTSLRILRNGGFRGWIMIDAWEIPDPYDACRKGYQAIMAAQSNHGAAADAGVLRDDHDTVPDVVHRMIDVARFAVG